MKKILSLFMCFAVLISFAVYGFATDSKNINCIISDTAKYLYETANNPQIGAVGGDWVVLGLARSEEEIPKEYYQNYYKNVEEYVKKTGGVLHERKYTEYSRVALTLTALGKDPQNVAGYNLLMPLGDFEKTVWQGVNGAIWALIALDSGEYEMPQNAEAKVQATREMYINHILESQTQDGGWAISGDVSEPDITAMALQALSKYQDNDEVRKATERALKAISEKQSENGGFSRWGADNSESCAQIIAAICELGISPADSRFVKNGNTLLDYLLSFYTDGNGFKHTIDENISNQMATEQCFYSMVAVKRLSEGKNSLYRMSDAVRISDVEKSIAYGLSGKNPDVKKRNIVSPGKTFADIDGHVNQTAIERLSERNIINGKTDFKFEPDSTITRAEFATVVTKSLGLPEKNSNKFNDITESDWFYSFVNTANAYGIVNGVSETAFNPNGEITREQAAVMITRAAKLCGMDTDMDVFQARDILAGFLDYIKASDWAMGSLAFCCREGILSQNVMEIKPKEAVTRAEIAQMLYNTLSLAKLL